MWELNQAFLFASNAVKNLLLVSGLIAIVVSYLITWIPAVNNYKIAIRLLGVLALVVGVYYQGEIDNEKKWQARLTSGELKAKDTEIASGKQNVKIVTKVVKDVQIVREKGDTVIEYIDREVIKYDPNCPVPKEAITALNAAAQNKVITKKSQPDKPVTTETKPQEGKK